MEITASLWALDGVLQNMLHRYSSVFLFPYLNRGWICPVSLSHPYYSYKCSQPHLLFTIHLLGTQPSGTWCCLCNSPLQGEPRKPTGQLPREEASVYQVRGRCDLAFPFGDLFLLLKALGKACLISAQKGSTSDREPTWGGMASAPLGPDVNFVIVDVHLQ